jgi:hypothetical protein
LDWPAPALLSQCPITTTQLIDKGNSGRRQPGATPRGPSVVERTIDVVEAPYTSSRSIKFSKSPTDFNAAFKM